LIALVVGAGEKTSAARFSTSTVHVITVPWALTAGDVKNKVANAAAIENKTRGRNFTINLILSSMLLSSEMVFGAGKRKHVLICRGRRVSPRVGFG
jgi:hypothetical protein